MGVSVEGVERLKSINEAEIHQYIFSTYRSLPLQRPEGRVLHYPMLAVPTGINPGAWEPAVVFAA